MRAHLVGEAPEFVAQVVRDSGLELVDDSPDIIVCYGGDGTLLGAERDWPGLPKVPLRRRTPDQQEDAAKVYAAMLARVADGTARETRLPKLEARVGNASLMALNDIFVRNIDVTSAVRFRVEIDGVEHFGEIVGDGLVVATPFGSSAYYRSITNSVIHVGTGLAFNNSTEPVNHLVLSPESEIRVTITRGPALLAADNSPHTMVLSEGDVVLIRKADREAVILEIENLLKMDRATDNGRRLRWLAPVTR